MKNKRNPKIDYKNDGHTDIIKDVMMDILEQTSYLSDEELREDRSDWIKTIVYVDEEDGLMIKVDEPTDRLKYLTHIHTISIEIEQLYRFGEIYYIKNEN